MSETTGPDDEVLSQRRRRRRDRWIVFGVLVLVAVLAVVALAMAWPTVEADGLLPWLALGILLAGVGVGASVITHELGLRPAERRVAAERARSAAAASRLAMVASLQLAARDVADTDRLTEVVDRSLAAARDITGAHSAMLLWRDAAGFLVAADAVHAPDPGGVLPVDEEVIGMAVRMREPVLAGRGAAWDTSSGGHSTIVSPLRLPDGVLGALVVVRGTDVAAFTDADVAGVSVFADQVAQALHHVAELEERQHAVEAAQRSASERAHVVAGIGQDLSGILAAVSGYVGFLKERDEAFTSERRSTLLTDVQRDLARMRELLEELPPEPPLPAGPDHLDGVVDLAELARDVAWTARGRALQHGGTRRLSVLATQPVPVRADPSVLRRLVVDLIDTMLVHTPPESDVELRLGVDRGQAWLAVRSHVENAESDGAVRAEVLLPVATIVPVEPRPTADPRTRW